MEGVLYRLTDGLSDITTTISKKTTAAFLERTRLRPDRVITVYNGVDIEKFQFSENARQQWRVGNGVANSDTVLVAIGRLSPEKDFPNLLHALKLLEGKVPEDHRLVLFIAGTGSDQVRQHLDELVEGLYLQSKVIFLGVHHDIPALLSAADVFALSSSWEGFGLVVAEAMACERVVVATDCGGVREVVGEAGFLCPPRNAEALALSLQTALALSPQARLALGQQARSRVAEQYSLDSAAEKWLDLYRAL
ncbi:hypothetical protein GCM10008955_18700 [Deinococcus malanensis]|uniref:Glycosyl transferase family 1 domain-containing protein n=2 Tax=Deinococcus malanensis TaxID=1706855 RepID=A0ABQ2ETP9_9DEIO|nr:hypothetical protein GCM10008955_18700 [Deinococcus malanensis]